MDVQMFEMDGFEVIWMICQIEFWIGEYMLIIVMIVYVMKGDCECCFEVGMDEYIFKLI